MNGTPLFNRTLSLIKERREKALQGKPRCIPFGFPRFEDVLPGIEQKTYYLITANQKVGKTQITDYIFMYNAYRFCRNNNIPLKIFYFTLEMTAEIKMLQAMSNLLYNDLGIRVQIKDLISTKSTLDQGTINILEKYRDYFNGFLESVKFIDDPGMRSPSGIRNFIEKYALNNGKITKKIVEGHEIDDYYEPNNPDEYVIIIIDHISLIDTDKASLYEAIGILSKYLKDVRNKYGYTPVVVQQQMLGQESVENLKMNKLIPSMDGLADNKSTSRDCNVAIGLFNPRRHELSPYLKYDILRMGDTFRSLHIIASRMGGEGTIVPLYFDGAVNHFEELPQPTSTDIQKYYVTKTK